MHKVVTIEHDTDAVCPNDYEHEWQLISFKKSSTHYENPHNYLTVTENKEVKLKHKRNRDKAENGLLFLLQYYEHSEGRYDIRGEGPQCVWDTAQYGGILLWRHGKQALGAKTYEDRAANARKFLAWYNDWANGHVYYYVIETEHDIALKSGCGDYTADYLTEAIIRQLEVGDTITIVGDCAYVFDETKLPPGIVRT